MDYIKELYKLSKKCGMPFTYYENGDYVDCRIFSDIQDKHFGVTTLRDGSMIVNLGSDYDIPIKDFETTLVKFLDDESSLREKDNVK